MRVSTSTQQWRHTAVFLLLLASLVNARRYRGSRVRGRKLANNEARRLDDLDVAGLDLSLFRDQEAGFQGGLFHEDTEGEDTMKKRLPQWRMAAGKAGKAGTTDATEFDLTDCAGGKGGKGGGTAGKASSKAPSVGKAYSKAPSVGKAGKGSTKAPSLCAENDSPDGGGGGGGPGVSNENDADDSPAGSPTEWDATDAVCQEIFDDPDLFMGGPVPEFTKDYKVDMEFAIVSEVDLDVESLLDKYPKFVRLYVLGCFEHADTVLGQITRRRLNGDPIAPLMQAKIDEWKEKGCDTSGAKKDCDYKNDFFAYYFKESYPDKDGIRQRVVEAMSVIMSLLLDVDGIDSVDIVEPRNDNGVVSKAVDGNNSTGSDAGKIVGATAGALALLMLIMFLAKRNRDDEVSHLKFEDDDTYVNEFEGPGKGRRAHVVGEADSVMSGWTGYSMDDEYSQDDSDNGKLGHTKGDVHMCSSATCEVCERRRQQGVVFVKTNSIASTPSRPSSIPSDASRDYVAEDVVML